MSKLKSLANALSLAVRAPKQWNSLASDTRHIQSSHALKTALKAHAPIQTIPNVISNSVFFLLRARRRGIRGKSYLAI